LCSEEEGGAFGDAVFRAGGVVLFELGLGYALGADDVWVKVNQGLVVLLARYGSFDVGLKGSGCRCGNREVFVFGVDKGRAKDLLEVHWNRWLASCE
jgi:hypothetical protein